MSLRWRKNGVLVCGAKSLPEEDDTYIDDRLHYHLSQILKVVTPDDDEAATGLWQWKANDETTRELLAAQHVYELERAFIIEGEHE